MPFAHVRQIRLHFIDLSSVTVTVVTSQISNALEGVASEAPNPTCKMEGSCLVKQKFKFEDAILFRVNSKSSP